MKSYRQANIWKGKIDWFKDGEVKEIEIIEARGPLGRQRYNVLKVLALVKDNLALHLYISQGSLSDAAFAVTEVTTGMSYITLWDRSSAVNADFETFSKDAAEIAASWTPAWRDGLGVPEVHNV